MPELLVDRGLPASEFPDGPVPMTATVIDEQGTQVGELLLWVESGYLATLEFAWWSDMPPKDLPDVHQVRVARK
jgi:hypothetical protein